MEVKERIAYVRGLVEGSEELQRDPATRSLWENLLAVCDGLADSISEIRSAQGEIEEYVEGIDADLEELEEEVYGYSDGGNDEEGEAGEDEEASDEDDLVRAQCPRCGEETYFEEDLLYDDKVEISCPECGEILFRGGEHTIAFEDGSEFGEDDIEDDGEEDEALAVDGRPADPARPDLSPDSPRL